VSGGRSDEQEPTPPDADPVTLAPAFAVHIGFSTTTGLLSRLIRAATGAPVSHCFIVYPSEVFGGPMVLEASGAGFRMIAWRKFDRTNKLIAVYRVKQPEPVLRAGLLALAPRLGDAYDSLSLIGYLLRTVFSLRRVPWNSRKKLVCSEAVALYLHRCGIEVGRIGLVTPRDLFELARSRAEVFELVETGKAFPKVRRRRGPRVAQSHSK
jgi:hypothetical protein